jgi:hypothetical protein
MRIRKRYVIPALASLASLAIGGVAQAATDNTSSLSLSPKTAFTPSKAPKTTFKNGKLFVHTHTNYAHPGDKAHGGFAKTVTIYFDNDFKFNTAGVPQCAGAFASSTTLKQAYAACGPNAGTSKNALIGTGTASTAPASNFPGCVAVFNGKPSGGNPTIILFTRVTLAVNGTANCANPGGNTSGNTSVTLKGTLTNAGVTDFGKKLTVPNVDTAPLPLDDFTAGIQRGNYVQAKCADANKTWNYRGVFAYSGAGQATDTVNATQACTVG